MTTAAATEQRVIHNQTFPDLFSQPITIPLAEVAASVERLSTRLSRLEEGIALEGRVSTGKAPRKPREQEVLFDRGQEAIRGARYAEAVTSLTEALKTEALKFTGDYPLQGKIFLALFEVLVSMKKGEKILHYKYALLDLFKRADGPDEARIKAAVIMCEQMNGPQPSEFLGKEKYDEYKSPLALLQILLMRPMKTDETQQVPMKELEEKFHLCLRYNPSLKNLAILYDTMAYMHTPSSFLTRNTDSIEIYTYTDDEIRQAIEYATKALKILNLPALKK